MTRRTLTLLGLTVALLAATAATTIAATYAGRGADDPKVRVSFEREDGKIKRFTVRRARFSCTDGDRFRARTRVRAMEIRKTESGHRKFSGYFGTSDGSQEARIRGRLTSRRKARGSFRLLAAFDSGGCDTRRVAWKANRRKADA